MQEAHAADLAAFQRACEAWTSIEVPLVDATPPDAWSAYRDLQGSSFHSVEQDSNPFRRVMEAIRSLETYLVETWLMSGETHTVDVGTLVRDLLTRHGLHCSESDDLVYLGLLLPGRGWIEAFKPLFRECLRQYLARGVRPGSSAIEEAHRTLRVTLEPLDGEVRGLFAQLEPDRASVWQWRLSVRSGLGNHEKAVVDQLRRALEATPPRFAIEPAP